MEIDGIDIAIAATEEPRTATIERIWLDTTNVRPGRDGAAQDPDALVPR